MSEQPTNGKQRYQHVDIHTCEECGSPLRQGHNVVCLSDGYVEIGEEYEVANRRFWHHECFVEAGVLAGEGE